MRSPSTERIAILIVIADPVERSRLQTILSHSTWSVHAVGTLGEALSTLRRSTVGVVVSGTGVPPDGDWKAVLREAQRSIPAPRVVVTDRLADARLWTEVLNLGGYDVLAQPFAPAEVSRVLAAAWRSWSEERRAGEAAA